MMKKIIFTLSVITVLLPTLFYEKALAEKLSSQWIVKQYTKSRLFVGGYDKENKILHLGWHVSLKGGWKTYWRTPGDAGLPPQWTWKNTKNIHAITVNWPKPEMLHIFDMDTFIYHDEVILPIDVKIVDAADTVSIGLDMQYLICSDICIPQEGNYSLDVSSLDNIKISRFQKAHLKRYRDMVPVKLSGTDIVIKPYLNRENTLLINLPEKFNHVKNIIVEGPDGMLFGRATPKEKGLFSIVYSGEKTLVGQGVTLTLLLKDGGASETMVTVSP